MKESQRTRREVGDFARHHRVIGPIFAKTVQVVLGWRGQEAHMAARENLTEKEFKKEVKKRLAFKSI
jgi:hypothetical protein